MTRTYWKLQATQGTQTQSRTLWNVYDAVMVPTKLEQEGWHVTVTEHKPGQDPRETYRTENDPIQAALDTVTAKLDAAGVPSVGF